jgi:hypothetical protein
MKSSKLFSLNLADFMKGLLMAILASVFAVIKTSVEAGTFSFDLPTIGKYALMGAVAYLAKNFFTNSDGELAKEPK